MRQRHGGSMTVARQVERHPNEGADDGPVGTAVVHDLSLRQLLRIDAGQRESRDRRSLAARTVQNPVIERHVAGLMRKQDAGAVRRKRRQLAEVIRIDAGRQRQLLAAGACQVVRVDHVPAIDVAHHEERMPVRSEASGLLFPGVGLEQGQFLRRRVIHRGLQRARGGFGGKRQQTPIGRNIAGGIQTRLAGGEHRRRRAGCDLDSPDGAMSSLDIGAIGDDVTPVGRERHHTPLHRRQRLVGEHAHRAGGEVHHRHIVRRSGFQAVIKGDRFAVARENACRFRTHRRSG